MGAGSGERAGRADPSDDGSVQVATEGVVVREVGGEAVLYREETGTYLTLNAVGHELWQQLGEGASRAALADHLVERYDIDAGRARADVAEFVGALARLGLVADPGTA